MTSESLAESYDHCIRLTKRTAGNFYYSFCGLPTAEYRAMCGLYAFMRVTDDWGDEPHRSLSERLASLNAWEECLASALAQEVPEMAGWSEPARRVLPAMSDVARRYRIPQEHLWAVIRGVRTDLEFEQSAGESSATQPLQPRFQTFEQLAEYCYLVAGAVGLCCIHIWGFRGESAIRHAIDCGTAFQLTNILRDVGEDADVGRVYLPGEDLQRFGLSGDDLKAHRYGDSFRQLMVFQAERAKTYFVSAEELVPLLEPAGRPILKAMLRLYGGLLREIERRRFDVFQTHVSLPRWRKLWIAADALIHQRWLRS